jgi:hypothetical protein
VREAAALEIRIDALEALAVLVGDSVVRRQSTGALVAASSMRTWPLATKAMTACVPLLLNSSMCGRTGFAPVRS